MNRPRVAPFVAALLLLLSLLTPGCAWLREDTEPKARLAPERIQRAERIKLAADGWPEAQWWLRFEDPQLTGLIEAALRDSPGMEVVRARTAAASAKIGTVESGAGPFVGAMGMINRMYVSDAGFLGIFAQDVPALGIHGPWYTTATGGLVATWAPDLWGKDRALINAAMGASNAQLAEEAQAELILAGGVAKLYFDIQTLYGLLGLLEKSRDIEAEMLAAHQARFERGLEPLTGYRAALLHKLDLDEQIINTQNDLRALHEALRAVIGADGLPSITSRPLPEALGRMPESLGFDLLARRPDLQAARWYVESSLSSVEAARAAFYPTFDIMAFLGLDAMHTSDFFRKGSTQFMLVPSLNLPIFDNGRLNANLKEARAVSDLTIAQYNEAVLNAVRDVAQAGLQMQKIEAQLALTEGRMESVGYLYESVSAYYSRGLADRASAMEARLPVLLEQGRELELRRRHVIAEITLIQALGGGYQVGD